MRVQWDFMRKMLESPTLESTHEIGRQLGRSLACGHVLALIGPLGSGKTTLVRGIADGAGVADLRQVNSPTFVIVNEYCTALASESTVSASDWLRIYHIDAYRLRSSADLDALGFDEMCSAGAVIVEWADRVAEILPPEYLRIELENTGEFSRRLTLTALGHSTVPLLEALR